MRAARSDEGSWEDGRGYRKRRVPLDGILPGEVSFVQEVRFKEGEEVPPHYHRKQTEVFVTIGHGRFVVDGDELDLKPGDIVVCRPGEAHSTPKAPAGFGFIVLKIDYADDDTVWLE